jgi:hypothetical protein
MIFIKVFLRIKQLLKVYKQKISIRLAEIGSTADIQTGTHFPLSTEAIGTAGYRPLASFVLINTGHLDGFLEEGTPNAMGITRRRACCGGRVHARVMRHTSSAC